MKLINLQGLSDALGIGGDDWIELDESCYEVITSSSPPSNDIGGEDCYWNNVTPEAEEKRKSAISKAYNNMSEDQWKRLITHRLKNNTQKKSVVVDSITFDTQNQAARYAMSKYSVSRNTAIRYIQEGRSFCHHKQQNRNYTGTYTGVKYE